MNGKDFISDISYLQNIWEGSHRLHPNSKIQYYIFHTFDLKLQACIHIDLFLSRIEFEQMPHYMIQR